MVFSVRMERNKRREIRATRTAIAAMLITVSAKTFGWRRSGLLECSVAEGQNRPREGRHFCLGAVPKLCPDPAFLTVLACVIERRVSNLQNPRRGWGSKPPSPHHRF